MTEVVWRELQIRLLSREGSRSWAERGTHIRKHAVAFKFFSSTLFSHLDARNYSQAMAGLFYKQFVKIKENILFANSTDSFSFYFSK